MFHATLKPKERFIPEVLTREGGSLSLANLAVASSFFSS
jgi:hypothetical protein